MKRFSSLAFRNLWSRKVRTLLTGIGIVLGVAMVLAFGITNATVEVSLNDFFSQTSGDANLTIRSAELNQTFRQRALNHATGYPNLRLAVGSLWRETRLHLSDKTRTFTLVGIDPEADAHVRSYELIEGRMVNEDDRSYTIVMVGTFAQDNDIQLGDDVEIAVGTGSEIFEVVGLLDSQGTARSENGAIGFVRLDVAQDLFAARGRVSQIDVVVSPEIAIKATLLDRFKKDLAAFMGSEYTVTYPAAVGQAITDSMAGLQAGLNGFSLIALFVGGMLIYNTFSMTIAERRVEIGVLRAIGTTRRQILGLVLIEAVLLAFFGSLVGIGFGMFLAIPIVQVSSRLFAEGGIPIDQFSIPPQSVVSAILLGVFATLVSALIPAWQASRISPMEAMRAHGETSQPGFMMRHGWKIGLLLLAMPVSNVSLNILPDAVFLLFLFIGGTLLVPVTIQLLERNIRQILQLVYGPVGGLGSRNLGRAMGRTSLTIGVLMIGGVLIIAIGSIRVAFGNATGKWIDTTIGGDITVSVRQNQQANFNSQLMVVPGVELATPMRIIDVQVTGVTNKAGFNRVEDTIGYESVKLDSFRRVSGFQFAEDAEREEEILAQLTQGDMVLLSTVLSDKYNINTGDLIRLRTRRGERDFEVIGIINNFVFGGNNVVGIWSDMERYLGQDLLIEIFMIKLLPGVDADKIQESIKSRLDRYSGTYEIESTIEFRETMIGQFNTFMSIFNIVVYIAILVAVLGVINTMTMNILERIREIGMLRSIGMTRWQIGRMVLAEAAAMGVLGALFGLAIGWITSEDMVIGMSIGSGWQFDYVFPTAAFVGAAITALIVSQVAALYPLWRASHIRIVEAIQHE